MGATLPMISGQSAIDDVAYGGGTVLSYETLIKDHAPEILKIAQVGLLGPFYYMTYVEVAKHFLEHVASEDSGIAGAVLVCGTNNLDELVSPDSNTLILFAAEKVSRFQQAFGLNQTTNSPKPFIVSGALRPLSLLSSDGPLNLYHSISCASVPSSRDRGVMALFIGRLTSAQYVCKMHANAIDSFKALEQGSLGYMLGGRPYYYFAPSQPNGRQFFDVSSVEGTHALPKVALFAYHCKRYRKRM
jgi:L-asparaginase